MERQPKINFKITATKIKKINLKINRDQETLKKNGSDNNWYYHLLEHIWNSRRMQIPKSTPALIAQYWPIPPDGLWPHRDTNEDMGYL